MSVSDTSLLFLTKYNLTNFSSKGQNVDINAALEAIKIVFHISLILVECKIYPTNIASNTPAKNVRIKLGNGSFLVMSALIVAAITPIKPAVTRGLTSDSHSDLPSDILLL